MTVREELAELEHIQWQEWINVMITRFREWQEKGEELAKTDIEEMINFYDDRLHEQSEKWRKNNIPYSELPEHIKDHDRKYVDKAVKIITKKLDEKIKENEKYHWVLFSYSEVLQDFKKELEK